MTATPPSPPISADRRRGARALRLVFAAAERGETRHFALDLERLDDAVARVAAITRRRYPDLAGAVSQPLAAFLGRRRRPRAAGRAPVPIRRRRRALGSIWRSSRFCSMPAPGRTGAIARPRPGRFSRAPRGSPSPACARCRRGCSRPIRGSPWRADAAALAALTRGPARRGVSARRRTTSSPGWRAGRRCCAVSARSRRARPICSARRRGSAISTISGCARRDASAGARRCCALVLHALGPIWPGRLTLGGVPLGDCGRHPARAGRRLRAVSQAQPMAGLFAGRAARRRRVQGHRARRADRPCRIPQWRPVPRWRRASCRATPALPRRPLDPLARAGRRVAGADRRAARPAGGAGARRARRRPPPSFRSPACSKAAPGRPAARSPPSAGRTAPRR